MMDIVVTRLISVRFRHGEWPELSPLFHPAPGGVAMQRDCTRSPSCLQSASVSLQCGGAAFGGFCRRQIGGRAARPEAVSSFFQSARVERTCATA